jgi:hypothetical protein
MRAIGAFYQKETLPRAVRGVLIQVNGRSALVIADPAGAESSRPTWRRNCMGIDLRRRNIVLASATAAALAPLAFARSAAADSGALASVPTVDSLTISVITDSSYDTPKVGQSKWVKTRRVGLVSPYDIRKTLHNEWGLALALESRIGGDTRQILLDFGYTPNAYLNNMETSAWPRRRPRR